MAFEILLTGDTFNEGRIKVNDAITELNSFWTGGTVFYDVLSLTSPSDENSTSSSFTMVQGARNSIGLVSSYSRVIGSDNDIAGATATHVEGSNNNLLESDHSFVGGSGNTINRSDNSFIYSENCNVYPSDGSSYANKVTILASSNSSIASNDNNLGAGQSIIASLDCLIEDGDETGITDYTVSTDSAIIASDDSWISGATSSFIIGSRRSEIENTLSTVGKVAPLNEGNLVMAGTAGYITNATRSSIVGGSISYIGSNRNDIFRSDTCSILSAIDSYVGYSDRGSIIGGRTNNIGSGSNFTTVPTDSNDNYTNNCVIIGGNQQRITKYNGSGWLPNEPDLNNSAIVGGLLNLITGPEQSNTVIIGGESHYINRSHDLSGGFGFDNNIILGGDSNILACPTGGNGLSNAVTLGGNVVIANDSTNRDFLYLAGENFVAEDINYIESFQAGDSGARTIVLDCNTTGFTGYWLGGLSVGTADYAEYFEWNDGNPNNEKRYGYAASIVNDKIEIGNSNIIGIVSSHPGVIADTQVFKWKNTFLSDEFGRNIIDTYKVYKVNSGQTEVYISDNETAYIEYPSGNNVSGVLYNGDLDDKEFVKDKKVPRINPDFDINQEYKDREERKEWSPIGLLGKLHVRTSEQINTDKVSFDTNGMAINGTDYHVLKSIKDYDGNYGIVQILFK